MPLVGRIGEDGFYKNVLYCFHPGDGNAMNIDDAYRVLNSCCKQERGRKIQLTIEAFPVLCSETTDCQNNSLPCYCENIGDRGYFI